MDLSKMELRKNRIEHSSNVRSTKDCREDAVFDKNNMKMSYSCRTIDADLSEFKRVRDRHLRSNQR